MSIEYDTYVGHGFLLVPHNKNISLEESYSIDENFNHDALKCLSLSITGNFITGENVGFVAFITDTIIRLGKHDDDSSGAKFIASYNDVPSRSILHDLELLKKQFTVKNNTPQPIVACNVS